MRADIALTFEATVRSMGIFSFIFFKSLEALTDINWGQTTDFISGRFHEANTQLSTPRLHALTLQRGWGSVDRARTGLNLGPRLSSLVPQG